MASTSHLHIGRDLPALTGSCRASLAAIARSRAFLAGLVLVALVDGVLLGLEAAAIYADGHGIPFPAWLYLDAEFSFGEIWEYCLTASAAIGLLWRWRGYREPIVGCLGLVFLWLTLDNMLALHETMGHALSPLFAFAEHSRPNPDDYGELVTFGAIGSLILVALVCTASCSRRDSVSQSLAIIALLGGGAIFGVAFDFAGHAIPGLSELMKSMVSAIEDGSELVLLSIAAVIAVTARPLAPLD